MKHKETGQRTTLVFLACTLMYGMVAGCGGNGGETSDVTGDQEQENPDVVLDVQAEDLLDRIEESIDVPTEDIAEVTEPLPPEPVPNSEFCDRFVEIFCNANQACCDGVPHYSTLADCIDGLSVGCGMFYAGEAYDEGRIIWDANAAGNFIEEFRESAEACSDYYAYGSRILDMGVRRGTVGEYGDCTAASTSDYSGNLVCQPGLECTMSESGGPVCRTPHATGACGPGEAPCSEGSYCRADPFGGGNCEPLNPVGTTGCMSDGVCISDYCESETCANPYDIGHSCSRDEACVAGNCNGNTCQKMWCVGS